MSFFKKLFGSPKEGAYYHNHFVSIKWNATVCVAIIKWRKKVEGEDFRFICKQALDLIEVHKATKWYENRAALGELGAEDQHWFSNEFHQKLVRHGVDRQAILLSEKAFNRAKYEGWLFEQLKDGVERRFFADKKEAVKWLSKV